MSTKEQAAVLGSEAMADAEALDPEAVCAKRVADVRASHRSEVAR